jgi:hypothetical protein
MLPEWLRVVLETSVQRGLAILPAAPLHASRMRPEPTWAKATLHSRREKIFRESPDNRRA